MLHRTAIPDFITIPELAYYLHLRGCNIPANTIRWWIYTGKVEAVSQFGKRGMYLFPAAVLDRLPGNIDNWDQVKDALRISIT